jgi:hypothetical protein
VFAQLARALSSLLDPLAPALEDGSQLELVLAAAGWRADEPISDAAAEGLATALAIGDDLATLLSLVGDDMSIADAIEAITVAGRIMERLQELLTTDPVDWEAALDDVVQTLPPPFVDTEALLAALVDVAGWLVSSWLRRDLAPVAAGLRIAGVTTGSDPENVDWSLLPTLFSDPASLLAATYGWGADISLVAVEAAMRALADLAPVPLRVTPVDPVIRDRYWGADAPRDGDARQYTLTLVDGAAGEGESLLSEVGIALVPVPEGPDADPIPTRLLIAPIARAGGGVLLQLSDRWSATVTAAADLTGVAGLLLVPTPTGAVSVEVETGAPALDLDVSLSNPSATWVLGDPTASRLEIEGAAIQMGIRVVAGRPEPFVALTPLAGIGLVINAGESDAFLRFLLGDGLDLSIGGALDISTSGIRVTGATGPTLVIPLHIHLGPLTIDVVALALATSAETVALDIGVDLSLAIGPLIAGVDGLGLAIVLRSTPDGDGTLGGLDVQLAFSPPHRIWFVLEAGAVNGSGFVERDGDRYIGGLSLDVLAIGIDAFTIIDTSLPGRPDGFALFATLTLRFPAIPLGFGFSLSGLGGILALNRTVDAEALALGLRDGAADAVLFPEDPVRDAELLVGQMDAYFPILQDSTVVGPVAEISWGVGEMITGQLGVVVSLADGVIVVLGSIEAVLPDADAPALELHLDTLGAIDPAGGTLLVVASLYDSRLLGIFELSGDAALYVSWLANPYFVLSVGGFHPGFEPPGHTPEVLESLRRMRASVPIGLGVSATIESYFAVTSNTVQFGGGFDIEASADFLLVTYTARGWFDFDVLIKFSPFVFLADASAGVGVYANDKELMGVQLAVHLEGPKPWYASGDASFKFFGVNVKFDFAVGGRAAPVLPPTSDVLLLVRDEMASPAAWAPARLPGITAGVLFGATEGYVRPDERVLIRQTLAPLGRPFARYGETTPLQTEVHVDAATLVDAETGATIGSIEITDETDWFAPAQYDVMSDQARLAQPSYERMTAGVGIGASGVELPQRDRISVVEGHETEIWEPHLDRTSHYDGVAASRDRTEAIAASSGSVAASRLRGPAADVPRIRVGDQSYVVIDPVSGRATSEGLAYGEAVAASTGTTSRVVPAHAGAGA